MIDILATIRDELILVAAIGFAIGGLDDLLVDLVWINRTLWRRIWVYSRHKRASAASLPLPPPGTSLAIFIPAWSEAAVIAPMLRHAVRAWANADLDIFVGCYPNDPDTLAAVKSVGSDRVRPVICPNPGPTTKADCLNAMWRALLAREAEAGPFAAVVLHDAEDLVHPDEPRVYASLIRRFALLQIPVIPLPVPGSRWISGHYLDEFIESHVKDVTVREAVGATIPLAGVGCAIRRDLLTLLADQHGGRPFADDSLTEDYEMGVRANAYGARAALVRVLASDGKGVVAVRAHFPATIETAVRQKSRWIAGIALSGWDRIGWQGGIINNWMLWRDRRAPFASLVLTCGYLGLILAAALFMLGEPYIATPAFRVLLVANLAFLVWRAAIRIALVTTSSGWAEGLRAGPRMIVSNMIAIMAAWRAILIYVRSLRSGRVVWDKTTHHFPEAEMP